MILFYFYKFPIHGNKQILKTLTLIELLVVLTILVMLSTLAISAIGEKESQARYEKTIQTFQALEQAIVGLEVTENPEWIDYRNTDYVSTLGNPPRLLENLWINPGLQPFGRQTATDGSGATLYCGWRGPYLRLAVGTDTLVDGWGNSFEFLDQNGTVISPLGSAPMEMIRSLGGKQNVGGSGSYQEDLVLPFAVTDLGVATTEGVSFKQDLYRASIDLYVRYEDQTLGTGVIDPLEVNGPLTLRAYHPDPLTGAITFTDTSISVPFSSGENFKRTLTLSVGSRAFRAFQSDGGNSLSSGVRYVQMLRGTQTSEIQLIIIKS